MKFLGCDDDLITWRTPVICRGTPKSPEAERHGHRNLFSNDWGGGVWGGAVFSEVGRGRRGEGERTGQNIFGSAALKATTAEGNFLVKEIVNENQRVLLEKKKFPSWVYRKLSNWRAGQPTGVVNTSSVYFSSKTQYKEWKTKMPRNLAVTGRQLHPFRRSH